MAAISIPAVGLQGVRRSNAETCEWFALLVDVDCEGDFLPPANPPIELVLPYHAVPLLVHLLLYMSLGLESLPSGTAYQKPALQLKIPILNKAHATAARINGRLLAPLTVLDCYQRLSCHWSESDPETINDFAHHPPPCRSKNTMLELDSHLALAKCLDHVGVDEEGTHITVIAALDMADQLIAEYLANPCLDRDSFTRLAKAGIEAVVYNIILETRARSAGENSLDKLLGYCQMLVRVRPDTQLMREHDKLHDYLSQVNRVYVNNEQNVRARLDDCLSIH
ncbi:MAG: hypothetical protein Q9219_007132 [cf. Caloplaca sp. 3 TL-2023]